ncbi:PAS domain-containing sensor histidine kinase [Desulfogranum mediterraneum]|uniref:PAS domain-containing sensor histidine kinase n=1 Tax=Desulfogranum mediterraneum TaxID=160661 RepID=UPI000423CC55|nr:histidine kinase dimerization/phosphoacceptor domain -containing protein [Desulfogranum mediterraneum]
MNNTDKASQPDLTLSAGAPEEHLSGPASAPPRFLSFRSIPLKICLATLLFESVFLLLLGIYFIGAFNREIDQAVENKLAQLSILMSQQALNYHKVGDLKLMGQLIREEVTEAFIINPDGTVLFTANPDKQGKSYRSLLRSQELSLPFQAFNTFKLIRYQDRNNNQVIASLAPLTLEDLFFGNLFIRISANHIQEKKSALLLLFLAGSIIVLALTLLAEAIFIHQLFIPRIKKASLALAEIERNRALGNRAIPTGPMDQIGAFLRRVNTMLSAIADANQDLKKLNTAGEQLAATVDKDQLYNTATTIICRFFRVQQGELDQLFEGELDKVSAQFPEKGTISSNQENTGLYLSLPNPNNNEEILWIKFSREDGAPIEGADNALYLDHLSSILKSAIRRINAFEKIALAEERYRELFSSAVEGIFRTTPSGRFEVVNPALATMSGYDSAEEMISSIGNIASQYYAKSADRNEVFNLLLKKEKIVDRETFFRRKDGSVFPAAVSCHYVKNSQGGIVAVEGRIINIEERKLREKEEQNRKAAEAVSRAQLQMVAQLEQNEQNLQKSLQEKEILLREIYHRTKNNMLVIISMLKLQLKGVNDENTLQIFKETENRIRAMSLVHEKLYQSESLVAIDLAGYLTEMSTALVRSMCIDQRIKVVCETVPVPISIDHAVPLGLAVNEIVTNSLKHGFPENGSGKITLQLSISANNMIQLRIQDDGIGLPENFSLEESSSFGLKITRNLISKQLGGTITTKNNRGAETRISFREPERPPRIPIS